MENLIYDKLQNLTIAMIIFVIISSVNTYLMFVYIDSIRTKVSADVQSLRPVISEGRMFFSGYCIEPPPVKFNKKHKNVISK